MKLLTEKEKDYIISLMKKGKSLNYISKLTGRNKSTLYYHYKKIMGKKFKDIELNDIQDSFIGELMGLFVGDGNYFFDRRLWRHSVKFFFNITEKDYVDSLVKLFKSNLKKYPHVGREKNVLIVRYYSKKLFTFIQYYVDWGISRDVLGRNKKSRTVFLKQRVYSNGFKKGFLRGFIDSDGYISDKKICFSSSSGKIIEQTSNFLLDLGFKEFRTNFYKEKRKNRVGMWHLNFRKAERERFFEIIKPRNLIRLNAPTGGRTQIFALEGRDSNH